MSSTAVPTTLGRMAAADRARARLADALRAANRIRTPAVEEAFRTIPRHLFLPDVSPAQAYADEAVAVQHVDGVATSSASQPSMVAIMLEQLGLRPGHRVLEIGAGTGYNAALIARIVGPAGAVTAVDIDAGLVGSAGRHLDAAGSHGVELICADGALGHPAGAPYDRIVLTVGAADVRPDWVAQLAPAGRLLLPLAVRGSQLSVALDVGPDGLLHSDSVRSCAFIRLRGIGAGTDATVPLADGLLAQVPDDAPVPIDPAALAVALEDPGPVRGTPVPLTLMDVWDGFGLWLALTEPGTVRLLTDGGHPLDQRTFRPGSGGSGGATVALVEDAAAAVVVRGRRGTAVQAYGRGGEVLGERVLAGLDRWNGAGSPSSAELELLVAPRVHPGPGDRTGVVRVQKEHSTVLVRWSHTLSRSGPARSAPGCGP